MTTAARACLAPPRRARGQFTRDACLRSARGPLRAVARGRQRAVTPCALMRAEAADFELLRALGQVSYAVESNSERTLTWSGGEDGSVPDSFSVSGRGASTGDAVMKLYAGKVVGWDDGTMSPSNAVPDVLLKEYVNAAAAPMADAEVTAYQTLYSDPNDSTIGQTWDGQVVGEAFDPASLPVVPLIAFFASAPVALDDSALPGARRDGSLWTVQAWGPGGLQKLADYPNARQAIYEQKWWPPVQRARDAGMGPRMRFARNAAKGVLRCVAAIHQRGVAHNAIDAGAFAVNTLEDANADTLELRLMNFGFASPLTEDSKRSDLRAAALTIAELAFSALAAGGPSARTSREALRRLFEDVFLLDERAAREYFLEEPEFAAVVEFFEYRDRQGDAWRLLVDCWRGDGSAEDALARAEAVETPYD